MILWIFVILVVAIIVAMISAPYILSRQKLPVIFVDINELLDNPEEYEGKLIRTQGWLADTGKTDDFYELKSELVQKITNKWDSFRTKKP